MCWRQRFHVSQWHTHINTHPLLLRVCTVRGLLCHAILLFEETYRLTPYPINLLIMEENMCSNTDQNDIKSVMISQLRARFLFLAFWKWKKYWYFWACNHFRSYNALLSRAMNITQRQDVLPAFFANSPMMTSSSGNIFCATGHLCGEFTGHRWIPHTKASNAGLWCFLWSASE